jgi:hypothetical protein
MADHQTSSSPRLIHAEPDPAWVSLAPIIESSNEILIADSLTV